MNYNLKHRLWQKRPADALHAFTTELQNRLAELETQRGYGMDAYAEILLLEEILGVSHEPRARKKGDS